VHAGRVIGVVSDVDGQPVIGATVELAATRDEILRATTDARGRLEIDDVPPGKYASRFSYIITVIRGPMVRVTAGRTTNLFERDAFGLAGPAAVPICADVWGQWPPTAASPDLRPEKTGNLRLIPCEVLCTLARLVDTDGERARRWCGKVQDGAQPG
jgi:hypothetical protein